MKSSVLFLRPTTPVENFLATGPRVWARYELQMKAVYKAIHEDRKTVVNWHRDKLGAPDFTWKGSEYLFRVYERSSYRLLVANGKGICLEVPEGMSARRGRQVALQAVASYLKDLGSLS